MDIHNYLRSTMPTIQDLRAALPVHATLTYERRPLATVTTLVVHHSASRPSIEWSAVARYHVSGNGWPGIGYHFGVAQDGLVSYVGDVETWRYHARDANSYSIGICCLGDYQVNDPPPAMIEALAVLCNGIETWIGRPLQRVGHRDVVETECPGDNLYAKIPHVSGPIQQGEPLPEDEPNMPVAALASKVRWWMEEYQRQLEAGKTARSQAILSGLIRRENGLLYRLENALA